MLMYRMYCNRIHPTPLPFLLVPVLPTYLFFFNFLHTSESLKVFRGVQVLP